MARLFSSVFLVAALMAAGSAGTMEAQEGPTPTQALVGIDHKSTPPANASGLTATVDNHKTPVTAWVPVQAGNAQIALLIDDGLRESVGRQLGDLRDFVNGLPAGVEILIGYMENGRVVEAQPFTTDHTAAAKALRLPEGMPGESASPYICLSDFVKNWPDGGGGSSSSVDQSAPTINRGPGAGGHKARFVLMISDGVDPYNGSTSIMNQDSPYVDAAIRDAQRAGVAVYSMYYSDAGIFGRSASFSGQSYLATLSDGTGGEDYFQGTRNPVSMKPFLTEFEHAVEETYVATFTATGNGNSNNLVRLKITSANKAKLHAPTEVAPGNEE